MFRQNLLKDVGLVLADLGSAHFWGTLHHWPKQARTTPYKAALYLAGLPVSASWAHMRWEPKMDPGLHKGNQNIGFPGVIL